MPGQAIACPAAQRPEAAISTLRANTDSIQVNLKSMRIGRTASLQQLLAAARQGLRKQALASFLLKPPMMSAANKQHRAGIIFTALANATGYKNAGTSWLTPRAFVSSGLDFGNTHEETTLESFAKRQQRQLKPADGMPLHGKTAV